MYCKRNDEKSSFALKKIDPLLFVLYISYFKIHQVYRKSVCYANRNHRLGMDKLQND